MTPEAMAQHRAPRVWFFWLVVAVLFVCLLLPAAYGLRAYRDTFVQQDQRATLELGNRLRVLLESEVNNEAFLATSVEFYIVAREGNLDSTEIQKILALVFKRGRHFRNIGIAPDNRIAWVFPVVGNEAAIGLNYPDMPEQWPAIQQIMATGEGRMSGPLELVQGGQGLIYRSPIFINDTYWGLLSTVIDADSLFDLLLSTSGELAPVLALRHMGEDGVPGKVFFGIPENFEQPLALLPVRVPGAQWQMAVNSPAYSPIRLGWYRAFATLFVLFVAIMLGLLLRLIWQRNLLDQLDSQVKVRTAELRQSHDLMDSVFYAASSFAIIATDAEGIITVFNKGAERMLGYQAQEIVGKQRPGCFLLAEEVRKRAHQMATELGRPLKGDEVFTLRAQQGIEEVLLMHYKCRDGHVIPVQVVLSMIKSPAGEIQGYLGIAEDISERLRNETLKNQFISTVSHELRTPLTAISGAISLVKSGVVGPVPDTLQPMLGIAYSNSQRLAQLVNDLLDVEKLMAGRMTLYPARHSVAELIRATVANVQGMADQQQVGLVIALAGEAYIHVDASRFQQVLTNLLSNAIKFSPVNGRVEIDMAPSAASVRITVSDQGPGIPSSFYSHIFERFAQADAGDNRQQAGTGLGLAISKELTEQMNGHIGFQPGLSRGSCFWVEFPMCEATAGV
ncbi:MAG: PAS domain S-box-containing protein [Halopseudomonas sp.]|jgi:PAS domain S-box-containing protein|uniref:ATP-binding protein n=1 Tax=Halopseudomonas sp. TaxID=2901191 RepID=UPI0039E5D77A